ncbi:membrane protein insertase YidC [Vibrio sp. SS-MA-C1-2]|uniref:membrane protein insertase YidC n=1 Tax=Vibrio sp. SS-MA-C1-2 TaxID=2908646 RepID=UPI001F203385|nr:membrane protein insertase YidC [Vibrio sp. SS-MA-C1-2]UJF19328.1 membrane protein insertase YidC [Vibrio sp. SS-MA-C1-2]
MESQRKILLIALLFVSFLLFQQWQADKNPQTQTAEQTQTINGEVPNHTGQDSQPITTTSTSGNLITINSDVLSLTIDTVGGDVLTSKLLQYPLTKGSDEPFVLLDGGPTHNYIAQSGLIGANGIDTNAGRANYTVSAKEFDLGDKDQISVPLTYSKDGINYTKTFIIKRGSYAVDVKYTIDNQSSASATVQMYAQLKQNIDSKGSSLTMPTYNGGAYSSDDTRYKKYSYSDMEDKNLSISLKEGWAAMLQHYFASAWIPRGDAESNLYTRTSNGQGYIGVRMAPTTIAAGQTTSIEATLWTGPKLQDQMAATANNLDLSVDYGWLWFIAKPLHSLLDFIHGFVSNWGVSIIILTFIVRGAMFPLTKAQYTSMAKMRMLQPKLQEMRERIGDDRQRMSQEMMALYKKEKVNPLGGCLPIVLQMPIFIALYWALMESVELRHAPFVGWITDLSAQDPYYILPVLMGISMFMIQKMSPTTVTDPMQQKIMTFMPVMFSFFFLFFPSGLVLYYLFSNIVSLIQQTLIYRSLEKKGLHSKS